MQFFGCKNVLLIAAQMFCLYLMEENSKNKETAWMPEDYVETRLNLGLGAYDYRGEEFDEDDGYMFGLALGEMIDGEFIVGRDHRVNSEEIKDAAVQGLNYTGNEVTDVGLAPTDMVSYLVREMDADGGLVVTASHMPSHFHGLKPLNSQGRILDGEELDLGTENFLENQVTRPAYRKNKEDEGIFTSNYLDQIILRYEELFDDDLSDVRIGVDPGHGMASITLPYILRELGNEEEIYFINSDLDPYFSERNPDPTEDSLEELSNLVVENDLDIGIALDGDADRAVYLNEEGEKVSGDESLAILGEKYLSANGDEAKGIACSGNTSFLVQDRMNSLNAIVEYQPVGAVFTAKAALSTGEPDIVFGGQPNGHFIDPGFTPYDSGTLMATVMPGIIQEKDKALSEIQNELPQYIIHRENQEVEDKEEALKEKIDTLDGKIASQTGIAKGVKNGQIVTLRTSGTEPVIRKMVETPHPEETMDRINSGDDSLEIFQD